MNGLIIIVCLLATIMDISALEDDIANGWVNRIDWVTMDHARTLTTQNHKPIMLIVHQPWCGACRSLKEIFSQSNSIIGNSRAFNMVNMIGSEKEERNYAPDGGYVPRILFLDTNGNLMDEVFNKKGNPEYKYFYSDEESVIHSMETVIRTMPLKSKERVEEL